MHTGPHHDDVELSYHGAMHVMLGREQNPDGTHVNQVRKLLNFVSCFSFAVCFLRGL